MTLREELPQSVAALVGAQTDAGADDAVIALAADMAEDGRFGQSWLIVDSDRLRVVAVDGSKAVLRYDIPLPALRDLRADSLLGGAALQARVDGEIVDLLRYSNAHERKFARAAKYLADVAAYHRKREKGETADAPTLADDEEPERRCPTCGLVIERGSRVCPACLKKHKVLLRLAGYLRPYWAQTAAIIALMGLGSALGLVPPYLTRSLVDKALVPTGIAPPAADRLALLGMLVGAMALAMIAGQAIGIASTRILGSVSTALSHDLRVKLFAHLQRMSLRFHSKRESGQLIARIMNDTTTLQELIIHGARDFVITILQMIGIGIIIFAMNWKLSLLVLLPVPLIAFASRVILRRLGHLFHRQWHLWGRLYSALNDTLAGIRVVKAFAKEDAEVTRFTAGSLTFKDTAYTAIRAWSSAWPILMFLSSSGSLLVWYVGGRQIVGGEITFGTLTAFLAYLGMFYQPLSWLTRLADWLARCFASAERVFEILDTQPDVKEAPEAVPLPRLQGAVEFRAVTFGYDAHKPVLKDISLKVEPGEMIGLVGQSGVGKTTTINLICRFYDIQEGQLLIDGVDIRKVRQQDLRSQIGVVLQDTFLFNDTIIENIRYAKPQAAAEEIMAAARAANAHDFIVRKPDGYDTVVGDRGTALSSGERQRISIARAILHDPRILILDEATASVDTDTEKEIQDAIAKLVKGRTTFAIAHRLSTLRNASRLVVLKEGKIHEMGTHDELLAAKGEFHRLVELQSATSKIVEVH